MLRSEEMLLEVRQRFDRLLAEWVPEESSGARVGALHHPSARAVRARPDSTPFFYGVTMRLLSRVRGKKDEELAVRVDGALTESSCREKYLSSVTPPQPLIFRVDVIEAHDTVTASPEALERPSRPFLDDGNRLPCITPRAALLLSISAHFAMTPRGRRALASRQIAQG